MRALQATVRSYDALNRSGTAFLDDGTIVPFGRIAFDAGGLRLLRAGQRVTMSADSAGQVTAITLVTLPLPG